MDVRLTPINSLLTITKATLINLIVFSSILNIDCTKKLDTGVKNRSSFSNGMVNFGSDRSNQEKVSTSRSGLAFSNPFQLDRTDPFSFRPNFPEVPWLNGWCPRLLGIRSSIYIFVSVNFWHACKELKLIPICFLFLSICSILNVFHRRSRMTVLRLQACNKKNLWSLKL